MRKLAALVSLSTLFLTSGLFAEGRSPRLENSEPGLSANIDFGRDSGLLAHDGICNDPRFAGPGMGIIISDHLLADATDCRNAVERRLVFLSAEAPGFEIDFGDNSGHWVFDGECDDPRFGGALLSHIYRDAADCYEAFNAGQIAFHGEGDGNPDTGEYIERLEGGLQAVRIFFATNRGVTEQPVTLTSNRGDDISLGSLVVTVPLDPYHIRGNVERPWEIGLFGLSVRGDEDPRRHFTIHHVALHDKQVFLRGLGERANRARDYHREAFVFVHGYNTSFDSAVYRTAQLVYDMNFDGVPILYSWPSAANEAMYVGDSEAAQLSAPYMDEFIRMLLNEGDFDEVNIICHSMGCNTAVRALDLLSHTRSSDDFERNSSGHPEKLSEIVLAAPDIDRGIFQRMVESVQDMGAAITLYASAHDRALGLSTFLASSYPRVGYIVPGSSPFAGPGIETIDITSLGANPFGFEHADYGDEPVIINDIALLMLHGTRPPSHRTRYRQLYDDAGNIFWRY